MNDCDWIPDQILGAIVPETVEEANAEFIDILAATSAELVSNCCSCPEIMDGAFELSMCCDCLEHCDYVEDV